eukprot:m.45233 g.45233  ORF g.45233 m.45233 type:complete len:785 (-) comp7209_c0_seq1:516-2870(-)
MSISEEDFLRLQDALMQLKTEKYESDSQRDKFKKEWEATQSEIEQLSKELGKANKAVAKSKKAKEVKAMIDRHEHEKQQLELQNNGLLTNLQEISEVNERLQHEVQSLKGTDDSSPHTEQVNVNIEELKADVTAQKKKHEAEIADLKARNVNLKLRLDETEEKYQTLLETPKAVIDGNAGNTEEKSKDTEPTGDGGEDGVVGMAVQLEGLKDLLSSQKERLKEAVEEKKRQQERLVELEDSVIEWKKRVKDTEEKSNDSVTQARKEASEMDEKYKKKQTAFLKLQKEKEEQYQTLTSDIDALKKKHASEIAAIELNNTNLTNQYKKDEERMQDKYNKALEVLKKDIVHKTEKITNLERLWEAEKEKLKSLGEEKKQLAAEHQELKHSWETREKEHADAIAKLKEIHNVAQEELEAIQRKLQEDDSMEKISSLEASVQKWKEQVDEFSRKSHEEAAKHKKDMEACVQSHKKQMNAKKQDHDDEINERISTINLQKAKIIGLTEALSGMEERAMNAERAAASFDQLSEEHERLKEDLKSEKLLTNQLKQKGKTAIYVMLGAMLVKNKMFKEKEIEIESQCKELEDKCVVLTEQINKEAESVVSQSKKDAQLIKELKKQLRREQKKAEKSSAAPSTIASPSLKRKGHQRTPSITSVASSVVFRENAPMDDAMNTSMTSLDFSISANEHAQLLGEVVTLKTEKEELRSKVVYLESKINDVQRDLTAKSLLIDNILTSGQGAAKNRFGGKDKSHQLKDTNEKMRTLLEETLMKNIQLEQLVEALTINTK